MEVLELALCVLIAAGAIFLPWYSYDYVYNYYYTESISLNNIDSIMVVLDKKPIFVDELELYKTTDIIELARIMSPNLSVYIIIMLLNLITYKTRYRGLGQIIYIIPPILFVYRIKNNGFPISEQYYIINTQVDIGVSYGFAAGIILGIIGIIIGVKNLANPPRPKEKPYRVYDYRLK